MSDDQEWISVPPLSCPLELRAIRHALANELLPFAIGLDLLPEQADGNFHDAVSLLTSAFESLNRQVVLLDILSKPEAVKWVSVQFPTQDGCALLDLKVPHLLPGIFKALPSQWSAEQDIRGSQILSTTELTYRRLFAHPSPAAPFAVPELGLGVSALSTYVHSCGGRVRVHRTGYLEVSLPPVS